MEAIIVMVTTLILGAIALPHMQKLSERQRAISSANLLVTHLALARNHAVTQRRLAILCPSSDGTACRADNNWSSGWLVMDSPLHSTPGAADPRILIAAQLPTSTRVQIFSNKGRVRVRYLPDGRSTGANTSFRTCTSGGMFSRIIVSNSGRARREAVPAGIACH